MAVPRRGRSKHTGKPGARPNERFSERLKLRPDEPFEERPHKPASSRASKPSGDRPARAEKPFGDRPKAYGKSRTDQGAGDRPNSRGPKRSGKPFGARTKVDRSFGAARRTEATSAESASDPFAEKLEDRPVSAPKPRKGRPNVRKPIHPPSPTSVRIQWLGFKPMYDFWGKEIKRFFQLETLANATERMFERGGDKFIVASIQRAMGPSRVTSLAFELFQEGQFQLIFRLRATNERHKQGVFGFVVAKKEGEFSKLAGIEHSNLRLLHERAPGFIVTPYLGGTIFLPDRLKRDGKGREIYAYVTQWLGTYHELGVGKNHQFYINVLNPQSLSIAQTEELKGQMVEIIARSYDPAKRTCMEMPQIASGDFVVTKPGQGDLKLKVIACRNLMRNMTPPKLIDQIVGARWEWAGRPFKLAPEHPETFLEGLTRAVGEEVARAWLIQYRRAVEEKKYPERRPFKREDLDAIGIGIG